MLTENTMKESFLSGNHHFEIKFMPEIHQQKMYDHYLLKGIVTHFL